MNDVAVVGCGRWGRLIVRDLLSLGCRVAAVDPAPEARTWAFSAGATWVVGTVDEAPRVDGVVVATPASAHRQSLGEVATRAVPVLCEKPLATSLDDAVAAAGLLGPRLFVGHVWRYHPGIQRLADLARRGALGEVVGIRSERANWTSPRTDVDPVWTLVPHDLSIAIAILGEIPPPAAALAEVHDGRVTGLWAHLGTSQRWQVIGATTRSLERRRWVQVHGHDGVATLSDDGSTISIGRGSGIEPHVERHAVAEEPALRRELRCFVDHLRGGPPPPTGSDEGVAVVAAVAQLRRMAGLDV